MKKNIQFVFALVLLLSNYAFAQKTFQGTVTFDVKITGENVNMYAGMMPNKYIFKLRNSGEMRMRMEGGMMANMFGDVMVDKTGTVYLVNDQKKSAQKVLNKADQKQKELPDSAVKTIKLNEVITIAGKKCQKYKVEVNNGSKTPEVEWMWVCEDIQLANNDKKDAFMMPKLGRKGINGFPLKIMTTKEGMTVTMTALSIVEENLNDAEFKVPENYKVSEFDPSKMMQGYGGGDD
ncbi:MAG: DUF4412 domain-containing protein [Bacteroidia bacterium]|nr:DUF4412 domain-containing protein [Bacteroidia bacterium]